MSKSTVSFSTTGLFGSCLLLTGVLCLVFPLFAYFGFVRAGGWGVVAAAVALGVCWLSGLLSLSLVGVTRNQEAGVHAALLGILVRMGLPLLAAATFAQQGGILQQAGVTGMILGYYLVALVVDTLLSVRMINRLDESLSKAS